MGCFQQLSQALANYLPIRPIALVICHPAHIVTVKDSNLMLEKEAVSLTGPTSSISSSH